MRPDGLTARGWARCAEAVYLSGIWARQGRGYGYGRSNAREARFWRLLLERIEARARREAGRVNS